MPTATHNPPAARHWAAWITLAVLLAGTGYVALRIAAPYLEAVLLGAVLAVLFFPLYAWLHLRLHRPGVAALITTIVAIALVLVPLAWMLTAGIRQLQQWAQESAANGMQADAVRQWIDGVAVRFGSSATELESMARARLQGFASSALKGTMAVAGAATSWILQLIVSIGALNVFLTRGESLYKQALRNSPLGRARTRTLLVTVHDMIRASFFGVVAVAAVQGILLGIGIWITGLPAPALWGIAGALLSVLPIVGTGLVWIPAAIILFVQGKIGFGIFLLIWGGVVVANSDNVVRPMIIMQSLQVNGLAVFVTLLGAIQAFGLMGIFVGPVTLALGMALLRMLREEVQAAENEV